MPVCGNRGAAAGTHSFTSQVSAWQQSGHLKVLGTVSFREVATFLADLPLLPIAESWQ